MFTDNRGSNIDILSTNSIAEHTLFFKEFVTTGDFQCLGLTFWKPEHRNANKNGWKVGCTKKPMPN